MNGSGKPMNHNWYGSPALAKPSRFDWDITATLFHQPPSPLLPFPCQEKGKKGESRSSERDASYICGGRKAPARPFEGSISRLASAIDRS